MERIPETARACRLRENFSPLAPRNLTYARAIEEIPPGRYSLPLIGWRAAQRTCRDIMVLWTEGERPYTFVRHVMHAEDLDETVALIVERNRTIENLGMRYVFMPIPAKQTLYAGDVDDYTRNFIPTLVARLQAADVEAVDLATPFQKAKGESLFNPHDTHWNRKGAELAARILSKEIFGK